MITEEKIPQKVVAMYRAVQDLIEEGTDINRIKVADITGRAGIGKGTAYEYFPNKEELISSALLYQMNTLYSKISRQLNEEKSFEDSIYLVLNIMDEEIGQRDCFLKGVHILTDSGAISEKLWYNLEKRDKKVTSPTDCVKQMIETGRRTGEIATNLPDNYLFLSITSKLVGYGVYIAKESDTRGCKEMQKLICEGLLKEFS